MGLGPGLGKNTGVDKDGFEWVRVLHVPELHAAVRPAATLWTVERNSNGGDGIVAAIVLEKANPMERWPALAAGGTDPRGVVQDERGFDPDDAAAPRQPDLTAAQRRQLEESARAATTGELTTAQRENEAALRKYAAEHPDLDFSLVLADMSGQ